MVERIIIPFYDGSGLWLKESMVQSTDPYVHIKVELGSVKLARMRTLAGPVSIHICFCHLLSATGAIVNVNVYNITEILCEREDREELLERLKDPLSNNKQG